MGTEQRSKLQRLSFGGLSRAQVQQRQGERGHAQGQANIWLTPGARKAETSDEKTLFPSSSNRFHNLIDPLLPAFTSLILRFFIMSLDSAYHGESPLPVDFF